MFHIMNNENVLIAKVITLHSRPNFSGCLSEDEFVFKQNICFIHCKQKVSAQNITSYPPPNITSEKHNVSVTPCMYHLQHSPLRPECVTQSFSYNEFSRAAALLVVTKRERCAQKRGERDSHKWKWCKEDEKCFTFKVLLCFLQMVKSTRCTQLWHLYVCVHVFAKESNA